MRFFAVIQTRLPIQNRLRDEVENAIRTQIDGPVTASELEWHKVEYPSYYTYVLTTKSSPSVDLYNKDGWQYVGVQDNCSLRDVAAGVELRQGRLYLSDRTPGTFAMVALRKEDGVLYALASRPNPMPVYFYSDGANKVFASDALITALVSNVLFLDPLVLSDRYLKEYVSWGYPYSTATPFEKIHRLDVGHYAVCSANRDVKINQIGRSNEFDLADASEDEKAEVLADILCRSVARVNTDIIPNLRLSAGKDSRILIAAASAAKIDVQCETRGTNSDQEVLIASELARVKGFEHLVTGVGMSVEGDVEASIVSTLGRMGGQISSEPQQLMYEGANTQATGQTILMGHSHIQRGGFARTMANDREHSLSVMRSLTSQFVSSDLRDMSYDWLDGWLSSRVFKNYIEPLHELHIQRRASNYLTAHYRDYSLEAVPNYPMISHEFVAACDSLTSFDKISERVIFKAGLLLSPELMTLPLDDDIWTFDVRGKNDIDPGSYQLRTSKSIENPNVASTTPALGSAYKALASESIDKALDFIKKNIAQDQLLSLVAPEVHPLFIADDRREKLREFQDRDLKGYANFRLFCWRLVGTAAWLRKGWLK